MKKGPEMVNHRFKTDTGVIKVSIWDTVGQERYRSINRVFYREAKGALLISELSSIPSQEDLEYWITEFKREANPKAQIIIVGNKADLKVEKGSEIILSEFSEKHNFKFFKVSAKTGDNVKRAIETLVNQISKKYFKDTDSNLDSEPTTGDKISVPAESKASLLSSHFGENQKEKSCCK